MKRFTYILILLAISVSIQAYDFQVGDFYYNITSSSAPYTAEVTYERYQSSSNYSGLTTATIPETVTYNGTTYYVTSIGDWAFNNCSSLTSVTIGNSVTSIGDSAFEMCSSLTSVTIGNSVISIGRAAFADCSSLTSITIPNSVTSIGDWAFSGCSSLTSVTIGNSVISIGRAAFGGCSFLTSITIPNSVTSIGGWAFSGCSSLISMVVESGNTKYDSRDNCNAIIETATNILIAGCQNTIIPNSVTSIGDAAFDGCSSLTSIVIPNSVTSIGGYAFRDCSSLTSITIPNSVASIGGSAFRDCSSLSSVTIPNSVTSIGDYAFENCSSLSSVTIPNSVTSIGDRAFSGCSSLTSITIPNSVTSIGGGAFSACSSLTSIIIPNSVTSIGGIAFNGCSSLTSITIPNSVTSIGFWAFADCFSLTSITIPNSVTSIGDWAFSGCSSLTSVTIGNSVTSIGDGAFRDCSFLTSIICLGITPPDASDLGANTSTCKLIVPHSAYNAYLRHAYWGQFLNIISGYAITLHTNNNQWGEVTGDGFYTNDTTITITATPYEGYTFLRWSDGNTDNPRTLTLTQDTVLIAEFATIAGQCGDNLYWSYDETAKTISIMGSGEMYDYTAETQPWLLFKEEIKEVCISNTATSIGTFAFEGSIHLGKVSIGTAMENIGANAFANCRRLYEIYSYASIPPLAEMSSFTNYNATLYVPCEHKQYYQSDMVFSLFNKVECISSEEVETDGVIVVPGANNVTITWLKEDGAETYSIVIKKDGEVVCTLTFNSAGQLINIAFAPGRNGNHPAQYAEQVANGKGYRFTVTGLEEGTHYTYNIDVKNTASQTINSHAGEFTTQSITAVDNITTNNANIQKMMRNGQLIILRNGVEYNAVGQEL